MQQKHKCHICNRNDVKLYRRYGNFLRDSEITCKSHSTYDGWTVPLIEDTDGSVWGYTSVPSLAIQEWDALPDA